MSAPNATRSPNTSTTLNTGCRAKVDDTSMNSLVNMPNGGSPAMAMTPSENTTASIGWVTEMPLMAAMRWVPLTWAMWPTEKKIAGFDERVHGHMQQAGEVRERPAHAEREGGDAHVLDRGIGEQALDVAAPVQHEGREHEADQAERHHDGADVDGAGIAGQHHLEAQQRIERDVEQQAGQHGRDRRRAFRMGIGQPGVKRREADLGAVADQQEHEGERQQLGVERRRRP